MRVRWWIWVLVAVGVVVLGLWAWQRREASDLRDGIDTWQRSVIHEFESQPRRRRAVVGETEPGSAWVAYFRAMDLAANVDFAVWKAVEEVSPDRDYRELEAQANAPQLIAFRHAFDDALRELSAGVRREDQGIDFEWGDVDLISKFAGIDSLAEAAVIWATNPSVPEVRRIALLGDIVVFATDLQRSPFIETWLRSCIVVLFVHAFCDAVEMSEWQPGNRDRFARALDYAEDSFRVVPWCVSTELVMYDRYFDTIAGEAEGIYDRIAHWYSFGRHRAEGFSTLIAVVNRATSQSDAPWAVRQRILTEAEELIDERATNPFVKLLAPAVRHVEVVARESLARIRMIRFALACADGGIPETPSSPFGGLMTISRDGDVLRITCEDPTRDEPAAEFTVTLP